MITAQRWSVLILFVILILVLILGDRHWEQSMKQQGIRPATAANLPAGENDPASGNSSTDPVAPEAPTVQDTASGGTASMTTADKPAGAESVTAVNAPAEKAPAPTQAPAPKTNAKTTNAVTKSVYQR
ncbi:hypothetical protein [Paenibacillus puerhi]|uniref:hypothetical protein n=1 Tax=Paenibacillus puerhi TaxID=2692622 RepID=UPI0013592229|nr:hypothetical protein [Paenibacillus puerhi]